MQLQHKQMLTHAHSVTLTAGYQLGCAICSASTVLRNAHAVIPAVVDYRHTIGLHQIPLGKAGTVE